MHKLKKVIITNKWQLLTNLLLFSLFLIITCIAKNYGVDYYNANSYLFDNGINSFNDLINAINTSISSWNFNIGQIILYLLGTLPPVIFKLLNAINFITYLNLIPFYIYGSEFKNIYKTRKYIICLFGNMVVTLLFCPIFNLNFIQMSQACNYTWGLVLLLLYFIPFRFLIDGIDIFGKKKIAYVYPLLALLVFFNQINVVPIFLLLMIIATIYYKLKDKKASICWPVLTIIFATVPCFLIFTSDALHNQKITYQNDAWAIGTIKNMLPKVWNYYSAFIYPAFILSYIYLFQNREKKLPSRFYKVLFLLASGLLSILIIYLLPSFKLYTTIFMYFALSSFITYILFEIWKFKFNNIILALATLASIFSAAYCIILYNDYDKFNKLRYANIQNQLESNITDEKIEISCSAYDNKIKNRQFLFELDLEFCYHENLEKLTNRKITTIYNGEILR